MIHKKTHQMHMGTEFSNGAQEWFCLECDRKILVMWEPAFKIRTIEIGDLDAIHTGAVGGVSVEGVGIESEPKGIVQ